MASSLEYVAILRCQTWHVWPELHAFEGMHFRIVCDGFEPIPARLAILSYLNRSYAERYLTEETEVGPLVWTGHVPGLYVIQDTILKAPEHEIGVSCNYRHAHRGEIDIAINFKLEEELPLAVADTISSLASAIMSLINLKLDDFLTATAPFHIRRVEKQGSEFQANLQLIVRRQQVLAESDIETCLRSIANVLIGPEGGDKLSTALELYAAHLHERQSRVRFLLLVMALEALAGDERKHQVAIDLIERWGDDLKAEMKSYDSISEEYASLEALSRELQFRKSESIRGRVRRLFEGLCNHSHEDIRRLQKRVLRVYDKRSTLVHDGALPSDELCDLEREARELVEVLFKDKLRYCAGGDAKDGA